MVMFAGEMGVARGVIAPESFTFAKDYHHL